MAERGRLGPGGRSALSLTGTLAVAYQVDSADTRSDLSAISNLHLVGGLAARPAAVLTMQVVADEVAVGTTDNKSR